MVQPRAPELLLALGAALRSGQDRFLIHATDLGERERLIAALSLEGTVAHMVTLGRSFEALSDPGLQLAVLDPEREPHDVDPLMAIEALGADLDIVLLMEAAAGAVSEAFARGVAAVLPRPLPENDALLRAHIRWLASIRRSRARGAALRSALSQHKEAFAAADPALLAALTPLLEETSGLPKRLVLGDAELTRAVGGKATEGSADVVVVGATAADAVEGRMAEARARAPGAAIVFVDAAPSPQRLAAAVYGGARAFLDRAREADLEPAVQHVARRRRAESAGRRLVEAVARFGLFDQKHAAVAPSQDVDPRLLTDMASRGSAFVPSGHHVLVVDDEVVVLTVLREALRRGGYNVTTASSAEQAIALMRDQTFDLVLTDKNLVGASGLDVLRFARTLDPQPAVVLITGYSSYDSAVEAMEAGALDYIEKPIKDVELLRQRIRRALCRRDELMSKAALDEFAPHQPRVLLVEEQEERRKPLADFLGRTYHVVAVGNGVEALEKLKQERFDVVLADRNLPGMTGKRVIEQAQQLLPHCASVLYTAYPSYESIQEAFEVGVDAFLVRPSEDMKALEEKIAGALRSRGILLG